MSQRLLRRAPPGVLLASGLGLAAFVLYYMTAARTITWANGGADGPELAAAAATLGVAHPPGYPLYLLLGHLFTLLPVGEVAFRVGLLSAVAAAVAVGLAASTAGLLAVETVGRDGMGCHAERRAKHLPVAGRRPFAPLRVTVEAIGGLGGRKASAAIGSLATGAALAVSPLFWSQATIPEVYALNSALVLAALALLVRWEPGRDGILVALGLVFGLGLAHHPTMALLAGPSALYVLALDRGALRRRASIVAMAALAGALALYLYIPIRAAGSPPINWGDPSTLPRFLAHVTARSYQGYLGSRPLGDEIARVPVVARLLGEQFTWPGLVLALLGLREVLDRRPPLGRLLAAYVLVTIAFAVFYDADNGAVYLLPAFLVLGVCLGVGVGIIATSRSRVTMATALAIALPLWQIVAGFPTMDVSRNDDAATYARGTLTAQPAHAIVLSSRDEQTFALWYAQVVEGLRPDVAVVDLRLLGADWYRVQLEREHPGVVGEVKAK